jgi:hypothetical protein
MTYAAIDTSTDKGKPYELFEFTVPGTSLAWRYTTRTSPITYTSHAYAPEAIARGEIERQAGVIGGTTTIELPDNNALAGELLANLASRVVLVVVRQFHETDTSIEARVVYRGSFVGISFTGATARLNFGPSYALAGRRKVVWMTYQASCNWAWGEAECGVNKDAFRVDASLNSSDQVGRVLTPPTLGGAADGDFNSGWVERVADGDRRFIESQVGTALTLASPFTGLTVTAEDFHIFPGCRNTELDCTTRFSNLVNHLGWARLPSINPFNRSAFYQSPVSAIPDPGDIFDIPGFTGYYIRASDVTLVLAPASMSTQTVFSAGFSMNTLGEYLASAATAGGGGGAEADPFPGGYDSRAPEFGWVNPQPAPSGALALFEVNVETVTAGGSTIGITAGIGSAAFDTWLALTSDRSFTVDVSFNRANESGIDGAPLPYATDLLFRVRIRTASDGLVRVQGDFILQVTA